MDFITATLTLLLILDPFGGIPLVNSLLRRYDERQRIRIIFRELLIALGILIVFLLCGQRIMQLIGLREGSLATVGGVVLCVVAFEMIFPRGVKAELAAEEDPFIVPLAIPLIAGPSCVAFLLLLVSSEPDRILEWFGALTLAWGACAVILLASPYLDRLLGRRGTRALERLMGMLLLMVGVQMLLDGVKALWGNA